MILHILPQIDHYHEIILHSKAYKHHYLVDDAFLLDIMLKTDEIYFLKHRKNIKCQYIVNKPKYLLEYRLGLHV